MNKCFKEVLFTSEQIQSRISELAIDIKKDYENCEKEPVFVGVLKGCLPFYSDLITKIDMDMVVEYIEASSWNGGTESTGMVTIKRGIEYDIENRDVLIVEDIIDSGITLVKIIEYIKTLNPKSIKVVTLLDKPSGRDENVNLVVDYNGFIVPDAFLIGYGLDYKEIYRNVNEIGIIKDELI